jgi:hypothetical protein
MGREVDLSDGISKWRDDLVRHGLTRALPPSLLVVYRPVVFRAYILRMLLELSINNIGTIFSGIVVNQSPYRETFYHRIDGEKLTMRGWNNDFRGKCVSIMDYTLLRDLISSWKGL